MGFAHDTIWRNILLPLIGRIECGWIYVHSIHPRPIKVDDNCTSLRRDVEDVGVPQVPQYNILFVDKVQRLYSYYISGRALDPESNRDRPVAQITWFLNE